MREGSDLVNSDEDNKNPATPTMNTPERSDKAASSTSTTNTTEKKTEPVKETFKIAKPVEGEITKNFDKEHLQESASMAGDYAGWWETHEAVDIACDIGSDVKAAADGKVVDVFNDDSLANILKTGFGMTVVVEHKGGYQTVYCNMAEDVKVKKGDTVEKGQVIGVVGDTATREVVSLEGSHLHFVVLKKSGDKLVTVNPQHYRSNFMFHRRLAGLPMAVCQALFF
jgi:murein DD-endopeptidase MepM/ murein hydrolase activator NlpD